MDGKALLSIRISLSMLSTTIDVRWSLFPSLVKLAAAESKHFAPSTPLLIVSQVAFAL